MFHWKFQMYYYIWLINMRQFAASVSYRIVSYRSFKRSYDLNLHRLYYTLSKP